jgi:dihydroflavonol-4-reductase
VKRVVVTGANGHVGYSVTKLLVARGYDVRATVRDASDPAKTAHLQALGVEIAQADLMRPETLAPVMEGRDGLFQVAAVYRSWARDPQREIIEPSITGGINALRAAHTAGVGRVVFTSSTAAVGRAGPDGAPLSEVD